MMPEISLNILDVAQNSVTAKASLIRIGVRADSGRDRLTVSISDNGCGMSEETAKRAIDPFYTTRTTRNVGLGLSFLKLAAELTGGYFDLKSSLGEGTEVTAVFGLTHIDRMPLGDIAGTMTSLIGTSPDIDFILEYSYDGKSFEMDTHEFREVLGEDVSLSEPEVLDFISGYIKENMCQCGPEI